VGGSEVFDAALEKLWIHGGAVIDADDVVHPGKDGWQETYAEQRAHRAHQAELIGRFSDAHDCRMLHLLRHFGDREDSGEACGICDVCAPSRCVVQPFRRPSGEEVEGVLHLVQVLRRAGAKSAGALFRELESSRGGAGLSRDVFETWISGLSRADLVHVETDSFEKDGEQIRYQRVALTERGHTVDRALLEELPLPTAIAKSAKSDRKAGKKRRPRREAAAKKPRARRERSVVGVERSDRARRRADPADSGPRRLAPELAEAPSTVVDALKTWRLAEARRRRVPAFRVLTDKALLGIAVLRPRSSDGLSEVQGVGPKAIQSYGAAIIEVVSKAEGKRG
jgi:DNA topoisomerase-3